MGDKRLGGCDAMSAAYNLTRGCCSSCHDDFESGDGDMIEIGFDHGMYEVCCGVSREYDEQMADFLVPEHKPSPMPAPPYPTPIPPRP